MAFSMHDHSPQPIACLLLLSILFVRRSFQLSLHRFTCISKTECSLYAKAYGRSCQCSNAAVCHSSNCEDLVLEDTLSFKAFDTALAQNDCSCKVCDATDRACRLSRSPRRKPVYTLTQPQTPEQTLAPVCSKGTSYSFKC